MKQEKLLDALNYVNQEYIDDATPQVTTRSRLRPWMALAACLALAVGIFAAARLAKPSAKPEPQASPEAAAEAPKADPGEPCYPEPNADAQTILDYRLGELYLGMPQQDVLDLYGEPTVRCDPVTLDDGSARDVWWYKRSGDMTHFCDFRLQFADTGDGWVVNEIKVYNSSGLELPRGIRTGMTNEDLLSVWPELETAFSVERFDGPEDSGSGMYPIIYYSQNHKHLGFQIHLKANKVEAVSLGSYYEDPSFGMGVTLPEEPYDFSSGEITVWRWTDGGWQSVQRTERGAKCLETIFTIEELVPLDQAPGEIRYVVDFQNDTVCLVCAPEEDVTAGPNVPPDAWGAVYHLEDRKALKASLKTGDAVPEGLRCLEQCVFPYGTWDTLGEAFE